MRAADWWHRRRRAVHGSIALIDRGSAVPYGALGCDYPDVYFANKVLRAQEAGAVAAIVVNNIAGGGLVNMVATSNDASSSVSIPSVFVSHTTGAALKAQLANASVNCVRASLRAQAGRLPQLVNGISTRGVLSAPDTDGQAMRYYAFLAPAGRDNISISVTAEFGNPDLLVSADGSYPSQTHYTWAARDFGADTLVIDGHDPRACQMCIYYVAVLATFGDVRYTITASIAETMRTLQAATPLTGLEVGAGSVSYFRFFVDATTAQYGLSFSVTTSTGFVELYASFDTERPSGREGEHQYSSVCPPGRAYCGPSFAHGAALHVAPGAPGYCAHLPCMLYLSVHGVVASRFSLLATINDGEADPIAHRWRRPAVWPAGSGLVRALHVLRRAGGRVVRHRRARAARRP